MKNFDLFTEEGFDCLCQFVQECGLEISYVNLVNGKYFGFDIELVEGVQARINCDFKNNAGVNFICMDNHFPLIWPNEKHGLQGISSDWPVDRTFRKGLAFDTFLETLPKIAQTLERSYT